MNQCDNLYHIPYMCALYLGPHKEGGYHQWLSSEFTKRGWMLELQAPQGPYTNVLDLQVFPAMSKKHSELLQIFNNTYGSRPRPYMEDSSRDLERYFLCYDCACFYTSVQNYGKDYRD